MMSEEVIRYGAGGFPYVGDVGPKSTEAVPAPVEEEDPQAKLKFEVTEDDTPLTEAEVVKKATKGK